MPSGDSKSRPYTVTDLGYDYNSGHLQFNRDDVREHEPRAYVMLRGDAPSDIHSVVKWVDERTGDDCLHLVNVLSPEEVDKHGVLTQEFKDVIDAARDIDEHARVLVRTVHVDDDGSETVCERLYVNEFDTAERKAQCYTSRKSDNPPKNWRDVHTKPDKDEWLNARVKELINLEGQYVWDDQPADVRPVRIITLYTLKRLADGTVEQYKCRMVADCKKVTKSDVGETFQHVGQGDSLKMLCAHAAQFRQCLYITDIDKAFLQGDAASVLWCIPPEGLHRPIGANGRKKIWKVVGNLYGKLDAPRVFGQCYETHLLNFPTVDAMGNVTRVMKGNADPSMLHYTRTYADGTVTRCNVLTYVDDNAWEFAPDKYGWCLYRDICDHVNTKFAIKKDERGERYGGEAKSFLGCQIKHDWETDTVELSLPGKIEDLLVSTGMQNANSVATTGSTNKPLHSQASPPPLGTGEPCPSHIDYQSVCGALLWIARMGRPDIMHRSAELARFMHSPGDDHAKELMHLLKYIKGTQHDKLVYKRDPAMNWDNYAFLGYVDSDFAPDYGDAYRNMKSTMGWIFHAKRCGCELEKQKRARFR